MCTLEAKLEAIALSSWLLINEPVSSYKPRVRKYEHGGSNIHELGGEKNK